MVESATRTRLAPTPSGYLHLGNAVNALLIDWWASDVGAEVVLRIDDVDSDRVRPEYLHDIFETYAWLDLSWAAGPRTPREAVEARGVRIARARAVLAQAQEHGLQTYACACSRRVVAEAPSGGCPGGCRTRGLELAPGRTALRVVVPTSTVIAVDDAAVPLDVVMGDFVIWRRDDLPAYQWLSVVEDSQAGMTHILRGEDLRDSSAAQVFLAQYVPGSTLSSAVIRHHPLVNDAAGGKLSKSQIGATRTLMRSRTSLAMVREHASHVARQMGIALP